MPDQQAHSASGEPAPRTPGKAPAPSPRVRSRARGDALAAVYDSLRQQIMTGELAPGAALVETAIAEQLSVSRTPVREALRRLEQDTLIQRSSRGLQVRDRSPAEILEIFDVRIVLEGTAARAAAERRTSVDLMHLKRLMAEMGDSLSAAPPEHLATLNLRLHNAVWRASRNQTLIDVLNRLHLHLFRYPMTTYTVPGRPETSFAEHAQLVDAIAERDAHRAGKVASEHMLTARNIRLDMWEQTLSR